MDALQKCKANMEGEMKINKFTPPRATQEYLIEQRMGMYKYMWDTTSIKFELSCIFILFLNTLGTGFFIFISVFVQGDVLITAP